MDIEEIIPQAIWAAALCFVAWTIFGGMASCAKHESNFKIACVQAGGEPISSIGRPDCERPRTVR